MNAEAITTDKLFLEKVGEGIPAELPAPQPWDPSVSHAPVRRDLLSTDEKKLALRNALRYFPQAWHAELVPEFADELRRFGRIYMHRFRPGYAMYARPIESYPARCAQAAAIMLMIQNNQTIERRFKVPYINSRYITPTLFVITLYYLFTYQSAWFQENANPFNDINSVPMFIFFILFGCMAYFSFRKNFSLIPVLGIITCSYLVAQIDVKNWIGFIVWLISGLIIYFSFSYKNSKLNQINI